MQIAYQSSTGKVRDKNEDAVGSFSNKKGLVLAIITDGIGGNNAGEVASQMVVTHFGESFKSTSIESLDELETWFENKLTEENSTIIKESNTDSRLEGMGTTIVAALIDGKQSLIANIGDSRGYVYANGQLTQITEDHSYVNELVKHGDLTPDEARNNPYKNIITKSLGINNDSAADFKPYVAAPKDQILLCTDGLTNMVTDNEIEKVLAMDENLQTKCDLLVATANQNGGLDNITVLIAQYDSEVSTDE
ncbi:Stp1/IreP family PP2C-type Ser/Thr phosphatase [Lentilactobacillus kisonensis]|uniref:protein-serine/threonine phosphatase n=2 Tax=Lentilactobacillus kisonensis TaxID=481722 RepID=H1LGD6_9LACO|nr:Stp1/IreP family PP2C-type Ser/Thr phosphatase [Lentilactobacillus kisonensis]EHO51148.1 putative serine/threonine phosphatase stp [Lentilactobacillus kisonensis F0435]KRL23462.1 serine threonine phosphatase stp [Lentilactobacillus kisonensis DSM 19906 = JCM 15041]